ncbi:helix-turn-helix transcriptional regulator [Spirosoma sp. BT702]|uniref:Helix-turn-helix transcriptional regulator n=1 Tax=Spirosoma profusum TaxID=2771354 RepID=A0A926Y4D6_9BACT|nr:helix-turn-helix transcriptional regulator [Spirosoma profusum]MBD2704448.1 helix-turn-helix transcriptional regulator [Spirosoma profusum]
MKYDFEGLKARIADIDDGQSKLAAAMGVSNPRIYKILSGTTKPELATMVKLNQELKKLEAERDNLVEKNPEIFLPVNGLYSPLCS